jgi:hypothetical protein
LSQRAVARALLGAALLVVASRAHASLLVYEPFDYATGALAPQNGGSGFSSAWSSAGANVVAGSLSIPGYTGVGNSALVSTGTLMVRNLSTTYGTTGTDLWFSFLNRVDSITAFESIGLGQLRIGRAGGSGGNGPPSANWSFDNAGGTGPVISDVPAVNGQTVLLAVHMTFLAGHDNIDLFVNPAPGAAPTIPNAHKTDIDLTVNQVLISCNQTVSAFDELRLGTTYADVNLVPVPEPGSLTLMLLAAAGLAWAKCRSSR